MPMCEAIEELRRSSGTQFDPRVVDALIASLDGYTEPVTPQKISLATIV